MTLVLQGGFADDNGSYHPGDFLFRGPSDEHAPRAFADEDCICLAVLDAPAALHRLETPLDESLPQAQGRLTRSVPSPARAPFP
jgi:anti-sigma factor ChrR (cupin superfamily)